MSRARELSKLGNANIISADSSFNVGLGTTTSIQYKLDVVGDANFVGVVTATSFSGDGSSLTGIANTAYIDAASITSSGIVSVTNTTASTSSATGALIVSGGVGIAGSLHVGENVSVGGTLTYEDVTNIDSVGIVTAQTGVRVTAGGLVVTAGVSTLAADLSIADKIVHTGDTNTSIRFPAADTFTIETSGTERVRVSSGGSFGINCESLDNSVPARDLEVASSDGAILRLSSSDDSLAAGERLGEIEFWSDDDDRSHIGANIKAIADPSDASGRRTALTFGTQNHDSEWDATERVRIDTNGSVGIGTDSPSAFVSLLKSGGNAKLQLQRSNAASNTDDYGSVLWRSMQGTAVGGINVARQTAEDDGYMFFQTASGGTLAERMRITKTGGLSLNNGELVERCYINSTAWSTNGDINLDNGMVQYNSANLAGTNNTLNITSSVGINTQMATGDMITVTCITAVNATTAYVNALKIDHTDVTENWVGGSAPTDGGGSGLDTYAFNIIKTGSAAYKVIANQVKTS